MNIIDTLRSKDIFRPLFKDWRPFLSLGEKGWIFVDANDNAQAGIIKNYISGIFYRTECLKALVAKETVESPKLRNGVNTAVKAASFRSLATIPASLLIGISMPYSRAGVLFEMFKNDYGKADGPLIWKAPTRWLSIFSLPTEALLPRRPDVRPRVREERVSEQENFVGFSRAGTS